MTLFEKLTSNARTHRRRIVLPEGTEPRTLNAANRIIADALADIILIGDPVEIHRMATEMNSPKFRTQPLSTPPTRLSSIATPLCCWNCVAPRV